MNTILARFLITCFVCELISLTTGAPSKYVDSLDPNITNKTSPDDNFSLIPLSLPNPITTVQKTLTSIGSLIVPTSQTGGNDDSATTEDTIKDKKRAGRATLINVLPVLKQNLNKTATTSPPGMSVKFNTVKQNINDNIKNQISKKDDRISNKDADLSKIDVSLIDAIFNDARETNTTEGYTTETGDYESTTTDEDIIRVPAPVLASLLGSG